MVNATWSIAVGVLVFIIAIILATIYYFKYKKLFLIVFITSISTYVFAVFYTWDVFELNKNWVLAVLIVSTMLMIFIGNYMSKFELSPVKVHTSLKEKKN